MSPLGLLAARVVGVVRHEEAVQERMVATRLVILATFVAGRKVGEAAGAGPPAYSRKKRAFAAHLAVPVGRGVIRSPNGKLIRHIIDERWLRQAPDTLVGPGRIGVEEVTARRRQARRG